MALDVVAIAVGGGDTAGRGHRRTALVVDDLEVPVDVVGVGLVDVVTEATELVD